MQKKTIMRAVLIAIVGVIVVGFVNYDLGSYLTLDYVKSQQQAFASYYAEQPLVTISVYMAIYILSTALSLPGASILTLLGGALFGTLAGTVVVSFASTIGATCAFLVARFLLRDWVRSKFGERLASINAGVEKEGALYLFTLRLIPAVPFFVINILMGLTSIRTLTYFLISQIGMLPGTIVYVNAGTQLAEIDGLAGILSPSLILSFVLLGVFPYIAKALVGIVVRSKIYKPFTKPKTFDYNVVAIGAGAAGLVTSYISAAVNAKVALIEKEKMGGDCLNTGCVPSKALIKSAKVIAQAKKCKDFGIKRMDVEFDFKDIMDRVKNVITGIEPHDSVERYTNLGVDCIKGYAKIISPYEVEIDGNRRITTKNIVIATGARPFVPPFSGLDQVPHFTTDTIWNLEELPKRMLVLGGGPIGCELAQSFARFGSKVTIVEMAPAILIKEDPDVGSYVQECIESDGVEIRAGWKALGFESKEGQSTLNIENVKSGEKDTVEFDAVLMALGRRARVEGFGLEELGIEKNKVGTVKVDEYLRTNFPNIFVAGDVAGPYQFTHVAAHQAWFAAVNALFSPLKSFKVDYSVVPWVTYTDPEVARVGLSETEAKEKGIDYEVTTYPMDDLDRAIAESETKGFVKVITPMGKDKVLGATIVGSHAGELITEFVAAMKQGYGLNKILGTIHAYPTLSEANKYAAGEWKRAHKPEKILGFLKRFHTWRRGA